MNPTQPLMDAREISQRNQEIANEVGQAMKEAKEQWVANKNRPTAHKAFANPGA